MKETSPRVKIVRLYGNEIVVEVLKKTTYGLETM